MFGGITASFSSMMSSLGFSSARATVTNTQLVPQVPADIAQNQIATYDGAMHFLAYRAIEAKRRQQLGVDEEMPSKFQDDLAFDIVISRAGYYRADNWHIEYDEALKKHDDAQTLNQDILNHYYVFSSIMRSPDFTDAQKAVLWFFFSHGQSVVDFAQTIGHVRALFPHHRFWANDMMLAPVTAKIPSNYEFPKPVYADGVGVPQRVLEKLYKATQSDPMPPYFMNGRNNPQPIHIMYPLGEWYSKRLHVDPQIQHELCFICEQLLKAGKDIPESWLECIENHTDEFHSDRYRPFSGYMGERHDCHNRYELQKGGYYRSMPYGFAFGYPRFRMYLEGLNSQQYPRIHNCCIGTQQQAIVVYRLFEARTDINDLTQDEIDYVLAHLTKGCLNLMSFTTLIELIDRLDKFTLPQWKVINFLCKEMPMFKDWFSERLEKGVTSSIFYESCKWNALAHMIGPQDTHLHNVAKKIGLYHICSWHAGCVDPSDDLEVTLGRIESAFQLLLDSELKAYFLDAHGLLPGVTEIQAKQSFGAMMLLARLKQRSIFLQRKGSERTAYSATHATQEDNEPQFYQAVLNAIKLFEMGIHYSSKDLQKLNDIQLNLNSPHAKSLRYASSGDFHLAVEEGGVVPPFLVDRLSLDYNGEQTLENETFSRHIGDNLTDKAKPIMLKVLRVRGGHVTAAIYRPLRGSFKGSERDKETDGYAYYYRIPKGSHWPDPREFKSWKIKDNANFGVPGMKDTEVPAEVLGDSRLNPWLQVINPKRIAAMTPWQAIRYIYTQVGENFYYDKEPGEDAFHRAFVDAYHQKDSQRHVAYWQHIHDRSRVDSLASNKLAVGQCGEMAFVTVQLLRYFGIPAIYGTGYPVKKSLKNKGVGATDVYHMHPIIVWQDKHGEPKLHYIPIFTESGQDIAMQSDKDYMPENFGFGAKPKWTSDFESSFSSMAGSLATGFGDLGAGLVQGFRCFSFIDSWQNIISYGAWFMQKIQDSFTCQQPQIEDKAFESNAKDGLNGSDSLLNFSLEDEGVRQGNKRLERSRVEVPVRVSQEALYEVDRLFDSFYGGFKDKDVLTKSPYSTGQSVFEKIDGILHHDFKLGVWRLTPIVEPFTVEWLEKRFRQKSLNALEKFVAIYSHQKHGMSQEAKDIVDAIIGQVKDETVPIKVIDVS